MFNIEKGLLTLSALSDIISLDKRKGANEMVYTISTKEDIKKFRRCFYSYGDETCKMQMVDIYNQAGKLVGFVLDGDFVSFSNSNKTHFENAKAYAQKRIYKNTNTWKKWLVMYAGAQY